MTYCGIILSMAKRKPNLPTPVTNIYYPNISGPQLIVASHRARGTPIATIARMLGRHETTIDSWLRKPAVQEAIRAEALRLIGDPVAVYGPMQPAAITTYERHLEDNDLLAARDVLEQLHGTPVVRTLSHSQVDIHLHLHDAGEPEINNTAKLLSSSIRLYREAESGDNEDH